MLTECAQGLLKSMYTHVGWEEIFNTDVYIVYNYVTEYFMKVFPVAENTQK